MPCDYSKYPANWKEISARIRQRDGNKCKMCGVSNGVIGYREKDGRFVQIADCIENLGHEADVAALDGYKTFRIVLTVAHHPDPDPMNCSDSNLQALCQRCHNRLDAPHRKVNAAETRAQKKRDRALATGQMELIP